MAWLRHIRTCLSQVVAHNGGIHTRALSSTTNTQIQIRKHTKTAVFVIFLAHITHDDQYTNIVQAETGTHTHMSALNTRE